MKTRLFLSLIAVFVLMFALSGLASADSGKNDAMKDVVGHLGPVTADGDQGIAADGTLTVKADIKGKALVTESNLIENDKDATTDRDLLRRSVGGLGTDSIIGADDRVRIYNTGDYPWRAQVHLALTFPNGNTGGCSGTMVGPHTVLTAGHCVFQANRGGWASSVVVTPGANGNAAPYGRITVGSGALRSVLGWTRDNNWRYDYGAIVLPTNIGNTVGWFGIAALSNSSLNNLVANLSGYPGDKPYRTQWYASGRVTGEDSEIVRYTTDMASGDSGAGVYRLLNGARHVFAVNTYHDSRNPAVENFGRRISSAAFQNYVTWIQ